MPLARQEGGRAHVRAGSPEPDRAVMVGGVLVIVIRVFVARMEQGIIGREAVKAEGRYELATDVLEHPRARSRVDEPFAVFVGAGKDRGNADREKLVRADMPIAQPFALAPRRQPVRERVTFPGTRRAAGTTTGRGFAKARRATDFSVSPWSRAILAPMTRAVYQRA